MSEHLDQIHFEAPEISSLQPLFPGYEIDHLIAVGGMGAVYSAVQLSLERVVAIKILPNEFSRDPEFCEAFEAEAKAMARLNHPNLIGVYDFGQVGGFLFIVMEFVPGQSLYHSAYGIAVNEVDAVRIVAEVCDGLAHAHEHGIIHRDIKPSNILLDLSAHPKIGDFGLARPVEHKDQEDSVIYGTPHYTAPEVLSNPQAVDERADIFSVGVMLHELLTNCLPSEDLRSASQIIGCDPRLDMVIARATHEDPMKRYVSAADMAVDLRMIASNPGVPQTAQTAAPMVGSPKSGVPMRRTGMPKQVGNPQRSGRTPVAARTQVASAGRPKVMHPAPAKSTVSKGPIICGVILVLLIAGVVYGLMNQEEKVVVKPVPKPEVHEVKKEPATPEPVVPDLPLLEDHKPEKEMNLPPIDVPKQ